MSLFWQEETQGVQTIYTTTVLYRVIPLLGLLILVLFFTPIDFGIWLGVVFLGLLILRRVLWSIMTRRSQKITFDGKWFRFSEPYKIIIERRT